MVGQSFVATIADAICAQSQSAPLETALSIVAEISRRQRLQAVKSFASGRVDTHMSRPQQVISAVCQYFGITTKELLSEYRVKRFVDPRAVAMRIMRAELRMGTQDIGRVMNRHHTSVLATTKTARPDLDEHVAAITATLRANWTPYQEAAE